MRGNSDRDGWAETPESQRRFIEAMADMWDNKASAHRWERLARDLAHDHLGMTAAQLTHMLKQYGIEDDE